jgi:hypothetical protein
MADLLARIEQLDDDEAVRLVILLGKVEGDSSDTSLSPDRRVALQEAFDAAPDLSAEVGDLARAALRLYAQDPANRDTLVQLMGGSTPERFLNGTSIAVGTAVLILLQTYIRFERNADGDSSIVIEKEAASTELLGQVVEYLLGIDEG